MNQLLSRTELFTEIADTIGNTPLSRVELPGSNATIFQKQEYHNPSGSHYDRVYLPTIQYLETEGLIEPGDQLRDITSGSAGISLSLLGHKLGYDVRITVPDELPSTRIDPMSQAGAKVIRCGQGYIKQASKFQSSEIKSLLADNWTRTKSTDPEMRAVILAKYDQRICYVNHSENLLSPQSFEAIGHEITEQLSDEPPSAVILAMGNWTTIRGIASVIARHWPDTKVIGYEGQDRDIHTNYGTSVDGVPLRYRDDSLLHGKIIISDSERDKMDIRFNGQLPAYQQIGHSSLMGLVAVEQLSINQNDSRPTVCLAYDLKSRY